MIAPATFVGDFAAERSVLLARVPDEAQAGAQVRAVHLLTGEDAALTRADGWVLQLGRIAGGQFHLLTREVPLEGQLPAAVVRRIAIEDPALLERGQSLALRLTPRGLPPPLVGVSVIVEWGVYASRRS